MNEGKVANMASEPRPGDIILFHRARGINRLITWFAGSPFFHVAIYAGQGNVIEAVLPGVKRRHVRGPGGKRRFVVVPAPEHSGAAALAWAEQQIGDDYGWLTTWALVLEHMCTFLEIGYRRPHHFSCGQFVARAFAQADVTLFSEAELPSIAPWHFAQLLCPHSTTEQQGTRQCGTDGPREEPSQAIT